MNGFAHKQHIVLVLWAGAISTGLLWAHPSGGGHVHSTAIGSGGGGGFGAPGMSQMPPSLAGAGGMPAVAPPPPIEPPPLSEPQVREGDGVGVVSQARALGAPNGRAARVNRGGLSNAFPPENAKDDAAREPSSKDWGIQPVQIEFVDVAKEADLDSEN